MQELSYTEVMPSTIDGITIFAKRDDLFTIAGVQGGKVRTCFALAEKAKAEGRAGLSTAGSRSSPQVNIVANIARHIGLKCTAHLPQGKLNPEVELAKEAGAVIVQHKAGYNTVIIARSREYAKVNNFADIPFGMECEEAVTQTRRQVANLPKDIKRIVMPVGSGMSLAGVLHGLRDAGLEIPVLGVVVGADPTKRLTRYSPLFSENMYTLVNAGVEYSEYIAKTIKDSEGNAWALDPVYEAKCVKFLQPGDLFWCVGIRQSYIK